MIVFPADVAGQQTQRPKSLDTNGKGASPVTDVDESAVRLTHLQAQSAELDAELSEKAGRFRASGAPWWRSWSWLLLTVVAVTGFALALIGGRDGFGTRLEAYRTLANRPRWRRSW